MAKEEYICNLCGEVIQEVDYSIDAGMCYDCLNDKEDYENEPELSKAEKESIGLGENRW